jgi:4-amino-4-deoxy-L-arabinose transferase-like glycosyltransferase
MSLPLELRFAGAFLLLVLLPGSLFLLAVFGWHFAPSSRSASGRRPTSGGVGPALEGSLLALGCGYVLAQLLMLALYVLARPLAPHPLLIGALGLNGLLLVAALYRLARAGTVSTDDGQSSGPTSPACEVPGRARQPAAALDGVRGLAVIGLLLALSAAPRLWNLAYSEFQGDEAKVVLRAMAVLQGVPDALIAHRKPPGEVLLTALFAGTLSHLGEWTGRLPFALAGVAAVLAIYALGTAMFGWRAGLIAALLLAVNGYWVAFGRILQYQSVGLLVDTLAVLCLYRFATGSRPARGYAVAGGLLLAGAGLTALSGVFLLPVAAVALGWRLFRPGCASRLEVAVWLWPVLPLAALAFAAYGPLAGGSGDSLDLTSAWPYLGPRLGEGQPYFHLAAFLTSVAHYSSSLYLLVVLPAAAVVLLDALLDAFRLLRGSPARSSEAEPPESPGSARSPLVSLAGALVCTWLLGPLTTHLFLIRIPGTHWREIFPPLVLLLGAAAAAFLARFEARAVGSVSTDDAPASAVIPGAARSVVLLALLSGLFLAACLHFVYVAWIQPWPEYQLNYPRYRHPLDWSNRTARDPGGTFGDVRHFGWKAIGVLIAEGELPATAYVTNDPRQAEAAWYLKQAQDCPEPAGLLLRLPLDRRERAAVERPIDLAGWTLAGQVLTAGRPTMAIYVRQPVQPARTYDQAEYAGRFDRDLASPWTPVGQLYRPDVDARRSC